MKLTKSWGGRMAKSTVLQHAQWVVGLNLYQCLWIHDLQVSRLKRLSCHAGH